MEFALGTSDELSSDGQHFVVVIAREEYSGGILIADANERNIFSRSSGEFQILYSGIDITLKYLSPPSGSTHTITPSSISRAIFRGTCGIICARARTQPSKARTGG